MTVEDAQAILAPYPEYIWLLQSSKQFYTTTEIAAHLRISPSAVRRLCEDGSLAGAVFYDQFIGWRIPRSALLVYIAMSVRSRQNDVS